MSAPRLKLAVFKFASCDGCQLSLLDCEAELLALADAVDIAYFPEATSRKVAGPYDLALVEGSIATDADLERIQAVRRSAKKLVTIGACATAGGIQALRNFGDTDDWAAQVYPSPEYLDSLATSTPIAEHVKVDFQLRGCPIDKHQLLEVLSAQLNGRRPRIPGHSVCIDCKRQGNVCVMVAHGTPCLGPVTHSGCGALCPSYDRGCYGCFGPKQSPTSSMAVPLAELGHQPRDTVRLYRSFNAWAPDFRRESEKAESSS